MDFDIEELSSKVQSAIKSTVQDKTIGIAFSGGVDSSLMAQVCHNMNYDITLLTIGFHDSHDINFSKEVNQFYNFKHKILEITHDSFVQVFPKIRSRIQTDNLSWNENSIAFYYVSKLANVLGLSTVVTANGVDELFCGYNAYRDVFDKGQNEIMDLMNKKLENELNMMKAVNSVTSEFGVRIVQPLLSTDFIKFAKTIPIDQKIHGKDDLMRKHAIRHLASQCGVPQIAYEKRKKALQYGSRIHKTLLKSR